MSDAIEMVSIYKKFYEADCSLALDMTPDAFLGLYGMALKSDGSICVGCPQSNHGNTCKAKNNMADVDKRKAQGIKNPEKTNVEWAVELGVSKRKVAKMRRSGELPE